MGDHLWQGGTNYGAVDGPGAICSSHTRSGGPSTATKIAIDGPGDRFWEDHRWRDRSLTAKRTICGSHTWFGGTIHGNKNCHRWSGGPIFGGTIGGVTDHLRKSEPSVAAILGSGGHLAMAANIAVHGPG